MKLNYEAKAELSEILDPTGSSDIKGLSAADLVHGTLNRILILGDNFQAMKNLLNKHNLSGVVDLVYIDPPFASNNIFKVGKFRTSTMSAASGDIVAYSDTLEGAEYLEFLRQRLILLRELMSEKASIYLHIDYKIGHYVKIIMDEVFGIANFKNDITRIKCNPKNFQRKGYGNIKDMVLFYTKTDEFTWNEPRQERAEGELNRLFNKIDKDGRRYTTNPLHAPGETANGESGQPWNGLKPPEGRHWRYSSKVLDELEAAGLIEWSKNGVPRKKIYPEDFTTKRVQDIWEFKDKPNPIYPTEKNLNMLSRIIQTSSNQGDLVLDTFCGSGGFLYAAEQLQRRWLGMDASKEAIRISQQRFETEQESMFMSGEIKKFVI
jgi:adenine-specific DNA-methyltransferase